MGETGKVRKQRVGGAGRRAGNGKLREKEGEKTESLSSISPIIT